MRSVLLSVAVSLVFGTAQAESRTHVGAVGAAGSGPALVSEQLMAASGVVSIAAGWHHTLVVLHDGTVWSWGRNEYGQLGDGTTENRTAPVQVVGLSNVRSVAAGTSHSLALLEDGTVWGWGRNDSYQLGHESREDQWTPVQVEGVSGVRSVEAGGHFAVAVLEDGSVWSWGSNAGGQLGVVMLDIRRSMPVQIEALSGARSVAAGEIFALALLEDGTVWGWGRNQSGQVGSGDPTVQHDRPVEVPGLAGIRSIAAGGEHALAVGDDGGVWAWGYAEFGQLGVDTDGQWRLATPARMEGFEGPAAVAAGVDHSFAVMPDGSLWAWGRHIFGRLGDGSTEDRFSPGEVTALSSVVRVAAGSIHSVALTDEGSVWVWGDNRYGQLGDGTTDSSPTPVRVEGLGAVRLAAAHEWLAER